MTHAEIAAMIRQHAPGALPESVIIQDVIDHLSVPNAAIGVALLPDDIAEAVLIKAMVVDACLTRWVAVLRRDGAWRTDYGCGDPYWDAEHGGILGSCFAAWKYVRGIE